MFAFVAVPLYVLLAYCMPKLSFGLFLVTGICAIAYISIQVFKRD